MSLRRQHNLNRLLEDVALQGRLAGVLADPQSSEKAKERHRQAVRRAIDFLHGKRGSRR